MAEVLPRITGSEMEWSVRVQKTEGDPFEPITTMAGNTIIEYFRPRGLQKAGQMLKNGSKYHVDVGSHIEYATPEDRSFRGTVTNEIAGEHIVYSSLARARDAGMFHDFKLNKRVVDDELNTWGYHTSYCCPADRMKIDCQHLGLVGLHLATQNLYAGAGAVVRDPVGRVRFCLAQKVLNLNCDYYGSTHGQQQPLLSTRDEALADSNNWRRVHLTSMDANMSPWATWMRLGTTSIVLRLVESGYYGQDLELRRPMHELALQVAYDLTMKRTVELHDGRTIRPLDIQGELINRAQKLELTDEEMEILKHWETTYCDLETDPMRLIDRADWVGKKAAIDKYIGRRGILLAHPEARAKDRQWDEISKLGIGVRMRQKVWSAYMPESPDIRHAMNHAPRDTRAHVRERYINQIAKSNSKFFYVDWYNMKLGGQPVIRHEDPYDSTVII